MDIKNILESKPKDDIIQMIITSEALQKVVRNQLIFDYYKTHSSKGICQTITEISEDFNICERHVQRIIAGSAL